MNKKELIEFLKKNLKLEVDKEMASYGMDASIEIKLKLGEEEIDKISFDLPNTGDKDYM